MNRIQVKSTINSSVKIVWVCYTSPTHIVNWNFAAETWCCPWAENDLRVGGKYVARMEAKDGSFGFDFEAVYSEIVDHEKISYTMGKDLGEGRKATVDFIDKGEKTEVIVSFEPEKENPEDMQRNGWQSILNNFKKYVENE